MSGIPNQAQVLLTEKGKSKDMYIKIREADKGVYFLDVADSPNARWMKHSFPIRDIISEYKSNDQTKTSLLFITEEQEMLFTFKTAEECESFHAFFDEKSLVHNENKAIAQLDEEMKAIWPFPGGSFF